MYKSLILSMLAALCTLQAHAADITVSGGQSWKHEASGLIYVGIHVALPAGDGGWFLPPGIAAGTVKDIVLVYDAPPKPPGDDSLSGQIAPTISCTIIGQVTSLPLPDKVELTIVNYNNGRTLACTWSMKEMGENGDAKLGQRWAQAQVARWSGALRYGQSPVLLSWLSSRREQFQVHVDKSISGDDRRDDRDERGASIFSILGGRAAIQETLQLQELRRPPQPGVAVERVPIAQISGVQVKAHPFETMLAGQPGGRLALADVVPADRFFMYFSGPAPLRAFIDDGAKFLFNAGVLIGGNCSAYDLKNRYLQRLGMDEATLEVALSAGATTDIALFLPDLFLIDGTDLTIVARLKDARRLKALFKAVGLAKMTDGVVIPVPTSAGNAACWCLSGDMLIMSTSRAELDSVLALSRGQGTGSLGRSAEFRYMLTQLPVTKTTRSYTYCSDPFIRRLVGPAVKLGQLRRMLDRSTIEMLTAGVLLYRMDHDEWPANFRVLVAAGYVPEELDVSGFALESGGVVRSTTWGTAARLAALSQNPVVDATRPEADVYRDYMERYNNFWRQFFDPIAIRLEDEPDGDLVMTTFILPLVENSIYNQLRTVLAPAGAQTQLKIPQLDPKPVLMLSLQLNPSLRNEMQHDLGAMQRELGMSPGILDQIGTTIHIAVQDGDPIIALGSGDVLGALGGDQFMRMGRGAEMMMIPVLLSILTRPCAILLEVKDPAKMKELLARGPVVQFRDHDFQVAASKVAGRDAWIYTLTIGGFIKIRLGLEVLGDYVVLSNLPWSQKLKIADVARAPCAAAAIQVNPGAIVHQMPALYNTMAEEQKVSAMQGIGMLLPMCEALGCTTAEQAIAAHRRLFGFVPEHPAGGNWAVSNGVLQSTVFGRPGSEVIPEYTKAGGDFGLFERVSSMQVSMQFEDTGFRGVCRWKYNNDR